MEESCAMPSVICSTPEVGDVFDVGVLVVVVLSLVLEMGDAPVWRSAGGGYRAKKRVSRGGSDFASLIYCREVMVMC